MLPRPRSRGDAATIAARFEAGERAVQRAAYRAETLTRERDAADAAHRAAETPMPRRRRCARSRSCARAPARRSQPSRSAPRPSRPTGETLERAIAAEALRAPIETTAQALSSAAAAAEVEADARAAWIAAGESADAAALGIRIDELTGDLAVATAAADDERRLEDGETTLADTRRRIAEFETLLARIDAARAGLPERLAQLEAELAAHTTAAACARVGAGATRRSGGAPRRRSRRRAARRGAARRRIRARGAPSSHSSRPRRAVTALLRRRLAGHAGELAAALVEGEACAVCGSTEHPNPAPQTADPVTDDDLADAERRKDAAASAERTASDAARAARAAHAEAAARAGGEDVAALAAAHAAAERRRSSRRDRQPIARDRLTSQRRELIDTDAAAAAEREGLAADLAAARETARRARASRSPRRDGRSTRRAAASRRSPSGSPMRRGAAGSPRRSPTRTPMRSCATPRRGMPRPTATRGSRHPPSATPPRRPTPCGTPPRADALDERIREHDAALRAERDRLRDLELELAGAPEELDRPHGHRDSCWPKPGSTGAATVDAAAHAAQTSTRLRDLLERAARAHAEIADLADDHEVVARLANTVAGKAPNTHRMTLESFVLAAELEEIVEAANLRLDDMSSGRYRLQHTDARAARGAASGLGLQIMDAHTGQARPAQSLSGGETFLASLSLALGLAEVVTARAGGVKLDTLFIDEGFGSLDDDTLDLAMRTLDELRQGGRTVGLISHVAAMKEQLPAQLVVEATPQGPSVIRQDVAAAV